LRLSKETYVLRGVIYMGKYGVLITLDDTVEYSEEVEEILEGMYALLDEYHNIIHNVEITVVAE